MIRSVLVRILHWAVIPLLCLVMLIALIVAEENLRGKLAWEKCMRDLEARGEHVDFAWFVPPPVPDDQNFAMTPLFRSIDFTAPASSDQNPTFTALEDRVARYAGRSDKAPFPEGRNIGWQAGYPKDLEVWPSYYRVVFPGAPSSGSAEQEIVTVTDQLDDIFAELRTAAKTRPLSRFNLNYKAGFAMTIPHYALLQNLVMLLDIRAIAEMRLNRPDDAFQDTQLALDLMKAIETEPLLISGLVRIGQFAVTIAPILEGVTKHHWTDAQLAAIEADMRRLNWLSVYLREIQSERAVTEYQIFRWAGKNPRVVEEMSGKTSGVIPELISSAGLLPGWISQNLVAESHWVDQTEQSIDPQGQIVDVPKLLREQERVQNEIETPYNMLANMSISALSGSAQRFTLTQAWTNEVIVACEIERYRLAHGTLPPTLNDLHVANLPHDPVNGQPLHYAPKSGDQYLLYSIGWNGTDDGGKVVIGQNGRIDFTKGDWVWSTEPVETEK